MTKAKKIIFTCLFIIIVSTGKILAQDTLPNFTVRDLGNGKAQISWVNPFEKCSTNDYSTII
jgi:hypothetical protein